MSFISSAQLQYIVYITYTQLFLFAYPAKYKQPLVKLVIEIHGLHTNGQLVQLFKSLRHGHAGCCRHAVNSFGMLDASEQVIQALPPQLVSLHIADSTFCVSTIGTNALG